MFLVDTDNNSESKNSIQQSTTKALQQTYAKVFNMLEKEASLCHYLRQDISIPWSTLTEISIHITKGLQFIHKMDLFHGHLNSVNVTLIFSDSNKITAKIKGPLHNQENKILINFQDQIAYQTCGYICEIPYWSAPELLNSYYSRYANRQLADLYSLGIVFFEMANRMPPPSENSNLINYAAQLQKGNRPIIPSETPKLFKKIFCSLWSENPSLRRPLEKVTPDLINFDQTLKVSPPLMNEPRASFK